MTLSGWSVLLDLGSKSSLPRWTKQWPFQVQRWPWTPWGPCHAVTCSEQASWAMTESTQTQHQHVYHQYGLLFNSSLLLQDSAGWGSLFCIERSGWEHWLEAWIVRPASLQLVWYLIMLCLNFLFCKMRLWVGQPQVGCVPRHTCSAPRPANGRGAPMRSADLTHSKGTGQCMNKPHSWYKFTDSSHACLWLSWERLGRYFRKKMII